MLIDIVVTQSLQSPQLSDATEDMQRTLYTVYKHKKK